MEEKDLKQIREIFREEFQTGFTSVWEGNLAPALDDMSDHIEKLDTRVETLETKMSNLPDKLYFEDKFADIKGDLVAKLRKEDLKIQRLTEMLKQKNILSGADIEELKKFQIFPT